MTASFWIYENWTHDRVRIHRSACSYCNNGQGTHAGTGNDNGHWLPFESYTAASAQANTLGRSDTSDCGNCSPGSG